MESIKARRHERAEQGKKKRMFRMCGSRVHRVERLESRQTGNRSLRILCDMLTASVFPVNNYLIEWLFLRVLHDLISFVRKNSLVGF